MIDLNKIVNTEILKARMSGMNDLATELLEISSKEKSKAEAKIIDRCFEVQDEYKKFLNDLNFKND